MTTTGADNACADPAQVRPEWRVLFCIARANWPPANTAAWAEVSLYDAQRMGPWLSA